MFLSLVRAFYNFFGIVTTFCWSCDPRALWMFCYNVDWWWFNNESIFDMANCIIFLFHPWVLSKIYCNMNQDTIVDVVDIFLLIENWKKFVVIFGESFLWFLLNCWFFFFEVLIQGDFACLLHVVSILLFCILNNLFP